MSTPKHLSAAERTLPMFSGGLQANLAPPFVGTGEDVYAVRLEGSAECGPAIHYRGRHDTVTLCGLRILHRTSGADLGVCQACRAEASRTRARVTR